MAQVLTRQNLRSKRFLRDEMFRCTKPGAEHPTDENWMFAIYTSIAVENGIELGIRDADSVFRVIKPFTERLFRTTFYHRESINSDYILSFQVAIVAGNEHDMVGEFCYRSDRNPFELEMEGIKRNWNLFYYLNQRFTISMRSRLKRLPPTYNLTLQLLPPTHNPDDVESSSSSPKPLKKIFKHDQCVICLDRKANVLFVKCKHKCACEECEKMHPSTKCPYCRTEISEKLLI